LHLARAGRICLRLLLGIIGSLSYHSRLKSTRMSITPLLEGQLAGNTEPARPLRSIADLELELGQRMAELELIGSVQQALAAQLDIQGIYDLVGDRVRDLFDAQVVVIGTFDHSASVETFRYLFEDGERFFPEPRPYNKLRQRLIDTRQHILINRDVTKVWLEITDTPLYTVPGTRNPRSMLFVPLTVGESVGGYVSLQNLDREDVFTPSDVRLLGTLADSMSIALENARLFDEANRLLAETEQRNAELAVINSVQQGLVAEVDMEGIYDLVGDRIREIFDAQSVIIAGLDPVAGEETLHYNFEKGKKHEHGRRPIDLLRRRLLEDAEPILINKDFTEALVAMGYERPEPVPGTVMPRSALYAPLVVGEEVRGYISLQNVDRERAFTDADVRLLSTLANSMSIALENARLFDETTRLLAETEQRNAELAVINGVQAGIVGELDEQAIFDLVGERLLDLDAQAVVIATFDHEKATETFCYLFEDGQRFYPEQRRYDGIRQRLIDTRKLILINENADEVVAEISGRPHVAVPGTRPARSILYVPLIVNGAVHGYISLQNLDREHAFNDSDVRLLTTLANSVSVALENARLFAETRQQAAELDTVNRISRALVAQLDLETLIQLVGDQIRTTFAADIAYLALLDQKTDIIDFPYVYGETLEPIAFGEGLTSQIIRTGEPLLLNTDVHAQTGRLGVEWVGRDASSYLGVPITVGIETIGVLSVQSVEEENYFDADDLRLLSTIAANVGIALQNAQSYQRLNEAIEELRRTQQQLVVQEKLASLGQLTAGIAHEIKNPLNFINNFSQLTAEMAEGLLEDHESEPATPLSAVLEVLHDMRLNASKILEHGRRADGIVRSMLEHSRGNKGERELVDLNRFLEEYVNLAYHGMRAQNPGSDLRLLRDFDGQAGMVPVVSQELGRVVLNILNNAFYAVHDRKREDGASYTPQVVVRTHSLETGVELRIEDNGKGIPPDVRQKIFEPFFTTKPTGSGTGLGLSLSYEIISQGHGGTLRVEETPGGGATFSILLPRAGDT
jgi:GAF domain-containing protein